MANITESFILPPDENFTSVWVCHEKMGVFLLTEQMYNNFLFFFFFFFDCIKNFEKMFK